MPKRNILASFIAVLCVLLFAAQSFADIKVISVKGQAKYKIKRRWINLSPGLKLKQGTKISTGINSKVLLKINESTLTIKQMSMIKIEENSASILFYFFSSCSINCNQ